MANARQLRSEYASRYVLIEKLTCLPFAGRCVLIAVRTNKNKLSLEVTVLIVLCDVRYLTTVLCRKRYVNECMKHIALKSDSR